MKPALIVFVALAIMATSLAFFPVEYERHVSPDGTHVAVVKYHAYQNLIPAFPGGSGDKSGWIVIQDRNGKKLGRASLHMVSMGRDILWSTESADLPLVGTWRFSDREPQQRTDD